MIGVDYCSDFEEWRNLSRSLLQERIHFNEIDWAGSDAFSFHEKYIIKKSDVVVPVPKEFMRAAMIVSAFRDDSNWSLLYRLAYRLAYENKELLNDPLDSDILELNRRHKLVTRDMHKMKAFVRFREVIIENETHYFSWHRPDHKIVRLIAAFFRDRFNGMNWTIMTDDECVSWDKNELTFTEGVPRSSLPEDEAEDLWKTYYSSVFNPGRIKEKAMKKEMPVRYWKTLPESELISSLMKEAPDRLEKFYDDQREAGTGSVLEKCRACGICSHSSGPVAGVGPKNARVMIVGEQPGDEEDKTGLPFQGPSGALLDDVLKKSGFKREDIYVTNAVKGFKHVIINSFRKHRTASSAEVAACRSWLKEELKTVQPELVICLGRIPAQSLFGKLLKMSDVRGKVLSSPLAPRVVILPHPATILRADPEAQKELRENYLKDFLEIRALSI